MANKSMLGIGNALVDILTQIPEDRILETLNLPKGTMQHADAEMSAAVADQLKTYGSAMAAGGSSANTMSGAAKLGVKTGYIGKVGEDLLGEFFAEEMRKTHVEPLLFKTPTPTGCAHAIITPDGERTFATYLGAALELSDKDLTPELFQGWDIFYVEGYLVYNQTLLNKALELAKAQGMTIAMDLASFNVVEDNRDYMQHILSEYIDIVFANQEEARAFTQKDNPEEALEDLASVCNIAIVKVGAQGSWVQQGAWKVRVEPMPANVIDTTGAGDLWAAGFMAGYVKGANLSTCARMGTLLASKVIEVLGAKMDEERWQKIFNSLEQL